MKKKVAFTIAAGLTATIVTHVMTSGSSDHARAIRTLTPGATFPGVRASDICSYGWASNHRHVTYAQRLRVFGNYHISYSNHRHYEFDHLIPLEAGGSNDDRNLWPQPLDEAYQKDDFEDSLHADVCAHRISLRSAWAKIRREYVK